MRTLLAPAGALAFALWTQTALGQTLIEAAPTYYNVSGIAFAGVIDAPSDLERLGPLPVSDGSLVTAENSFSDASGGIVGVQTQVAAGAFVSSYVSGSSGTTPLWGTSVAIWKGQIKNDSSASRDLIVDLLTFTDASLIAGPSTLDGPSSRAAFVANATLGGTRYRQLFGYPGFYQLDGGVIAPDGFIDLTLTLAAPRFAVTELSFANAYLEVAQLEWSATPVPELPSAATLAPGFVLLALLRRRPNGGRSR